MKAAWVLLPEGERLHGWGDVLRMPHDERPLMYEPCDVPFVNPPVGLWYQVLEVPDKWELKEYTERWRD